jgi:hypothetical protein
MFQAIRLLSSKESLQRVGDGSKFQKKLLSSSSISPKYSLGNILPILETQRQYHCLCRIHSLSPDQEKKNQGITSLVFYSRPSP